MENKYYWYVFDYSAPGIFMFRDDNPVDSNEEDIIRRHGFTPSVCEWMVTEEPLEIYNL